MARSQVQYGSQGNDVKELQTILNKSGYNLTVDGIFGANTQKAVKDYQQKNGLTVDGIVGTNTWASLSGGSTTSTSNSFKYDDFSYDEYEESDAVKNAGSALNTHLENKPSEYQSQWDIQLKDTINKILNREEFSYDLNGDALYQQYKDKYIQQGKMAMGDAIGQASAMTGGYGNSYAQSVGQQAYQNQLDNLNDIVPELYQMALDKYNMEGQDLYNQYSMLGAQEDRDYGRYRDSVSDWNADRDYLAGRYDSERDYDYSRYNNDRNFAYGQYSDDRTLAYNEHRNAIADEQWQRQFDEAQRQFNEQMALNKKEYDAKYGNTTSGGSSGGGSYSGGSSGGSYSGSGNGGGNGGGAGNNGSTPNTNNTSTVPEDIKNKAKTFTNNDALNEYLTKQRDAGNITNEQMGQLYLENEISSLNNRNWTLVDDGGVNWFWGIDGNAKVKDQYGNTYTMDKLVDALVADGMSKKDAKDYVKKLQKNLGA